MIVTTPYVYFMAALTMLLLPLEWLLAAVTAGTFHEACHLGMLLLCGGRVKRIDLGIGGCVIMSSVLSFWRQVLCILAGPLGSFLLLFVSGVYPKLALCGLIQGIYNLIPVYPLDGGRVLQLLVFCFCPSWAEGILKCLEVFTFISISLLSLWACVVWKLGFCSILCGFLLIIKLFPRKTPCKPSEIRVQ